MKSVLKRIGLGGKATQGGLEVSKGLNLMSCGGTAALSLDLTSSTPERTATRAITKGSNQIHRSQTHRGRTQLVGELQEAKGEGRPLNSRARDGSQVNALVSEEEEAVREYVARARTGDKAAFRMLVETYQQRIYAVAFGVIGNAQDAEDIVQDAFVKAYRKLDTFKGQSSFYTWIYRITFNLSVDLSRKRYRHRELMFGDTKGIEVGVGRVGDSSAASQALLDRNSDPERDLHRSQLRKGIQTALRDLSPEHRAVITLREIEGLSYAEISEVIGVSKGTVMSRLHHARRRLQRTLAQFLTPEDSSKEAAAVSVVSPSTVKAL